MSQFVKCFLPFDFLISYSFFSVRYHEFYLASKGNQFKNKKVLIEAIHKSKQEKIKTDKLTQQQEARRQKNVELRKKKLDRKHLGEKKEVANK